MSFTVKAALARGRPDRKGYEKLSYDQHLERIKSVKPTVDVSAPRPHPLSNKRELEKRRKYAAIEFDNKLLLERLATIVQHKTIDNEMDKTTNSHQVFRKKVLIQKKRQEMQKITEENQRLLKRIQEVPPAYNHLEWEDDAKHREDIKRILAMYPEYYERLEKEKLKKQTNKFGDTNMSSLATLYKSRSSTSVQLPPINKYSY